MDPRDPGLADLRRRSRPTLVVRPRPSREPSTVALLAGSFDPITIGHAAMAEAASARAELVVLVYSVRTLPKEGTVPPALLPEDGRVAALERFCERRGFAMGLSSHGLLAEHVEGAAERFPSSELLVVMGSDKLLQVLDPRWYDDRDAALDSMFRRASVLYAVRAGDRAAVEGVLSRPDNRRWADRIGPLEIPPEAAAVSSRLVRERLSRGEDVSDLVPEEIRSLLPAGPR